MRNGAAILFSLTLSCIPVLSCAQNRLEIIPLRYRSAEEIMPVIRPMLSTSGSLSGTGYQVIVKTDPENMAQLTKLIQKLDREPRSLMITVRQDIKETRTSKDFTVNGVLTDGDISIIKQSRSSTGSAKIRVNDQDGNSLAYSSGRKSVGINSENDFQVQVIEGRPAYIKSGRLYPILQMVTYIHQGGVSTRESVDFHDSSSGFFVTPRVNGKTVELLIAPAMSSPDSLGGRAFDYQNLETTIRGTIGEWIEIGRINSSESRQAAELTQRSGSESSGIRGVFLKVDEIP